MPCLKEVARNEAVDSRRGNDFRLIHFSVEGVERGNRNGRVENNFLPTPPMKGPFIDAHGGAVVGFKVPAQCSLAALEAGVGGNATDERAAVAPGRPSVRPSVALRRLDRSIKLPFALHSPSGMKNTLYSSNSLALAFQPRRHFGSEAEEAARQLRMAHGDMGKTRISFHFSS